MNEKDLSMICLLGKPFNFEGIGFLHTLTLNEISDISFEKYNQILSMLCVSEQDIREMLNVENVDAKIEPFEFLLYNCFYSEVSFRDRIFEAFKIFLKEDIFINEEGYFSVGSIDSDRKIHKLNYNYFVDILKYQNCIQKQKEEIKLKSKNDKVKEYLKKLQKAKAEYNEKFEEQTQIGDIVSSVCAKHPSINLLNVGNLTLYQLIDQYKRLNMIDEYFINIESLLHGASNEDVKITHWSSNYIKNNEN